MDRRKRLVRRPARSEEPDFDLFKNTIKDLYITQRKTREFVSKFMRDQYDFVATKYQYEKAFNSWGWTKNIPARIWDVVCPHLHLCMQNNTTFEVFYYGEKVEDKKVWQEMQKRPLRHQGYHNAVSSSLPAGIKILPPPMETIRLLKNLPSVSVFGKTLLCTNDSLNHVLHPSPFLLEAAPTNVISHQSSDLINREEHQSKLLQAVIPFSQSWPVPEAPLNDNLALYKHISLRYEQIMFSLANNFAGLDSAFKESVVQFLRSSANQALYQTIRSNLRSYAAKAIVHNLFRAAIDSGDAGTVELILDRSNAGVDVNNFICFAYGRKLTPLEKASSLQHRAVVEVLVRFGANADLTYFGGYDCPDLKDAGALQHALGTSPLHRVLYSDIRVDREIIRMLVDAKTVGSSYLLRELLIVGQYSLFRTVREQLGLEYHTEWFEKDWCIIASGLVSAESLSEIILTVCEAGVDPNCVVHDARSKQTCSLIDSIAKKGCTEAVKQLLNSGAMVTSQTLYHAVSSGSADMVCFLLAHGEATDKNEMAPIDMLSAAIRFDQDTKDILQMLAVTPLLQHLAHCRSFNDALDATSNAGSALVIQALARHGLSFSKEKLGEALVLAIRKGERSTAESLIDLGADTNRVMGADKSVSPLLQALETRDADTVYRLLDADADPNCSMASTKYVCKTLVCRHAVKWGNLGILQALIDTGLELCSALVIAISEGDLDLVKFLLQQGAPINGVDHDLFGYSSTPLATAVKAGHAQMVEYLLSSGAEPHDSKALLEAAKHHRSLCDLLLHRYRARYPCDNSGFGVSTMLHAIEIADLQLFKELISRGLNPAIIASDHFQIEVSPFAAAVTRSGNGDMRFVEFLLQQGLSPQLVVSRERQYRGNLGDICRDKTAFLVAISTGSTDLVQLFIRHNANVRLPARMGIKRTPLQEAAEHGHLDIVRMLIRSNADVNDLPAKRGGGTSLQLAAIGGYNAVITLLLSYGADVDGPVSTVNGRTALEGAAEHGRLDTAAILLNAGAARNGKDLEQIQSAIQYAAENGFIVVSEMLGNYLATGSINSIIPAPMHSTPIRKEQMCLARPSSCSAPHPVTEEMFAKWMERTRYIRGRQKSYFNSAESPSL